MYSVLASSRFERNLKKCQKKNWDVSALKEAVSYLAKSDICKMPALFKDHSLTGNMAQLRAFHVNNAKTPKKDTWIVLYRIDGTKVLLLETGTHDDVYGKS